MTTYRLTLEYDGRDFRGWQVQPGDSRTVQGTLERALARVTGAQVRVVGASRTDAGVHAEGQVASFAARIRHDASQLARALGGVLPPDLAVVEARAAPDDFDARRAARSKLYRYRIWNGAGRSPLRERYAYAVRRPLDLDAMREAASALTGTHDFKAFQAARSDAVSTHRSLSRVELESHEAPGGRELLLWVAGDAFLRHMIRILVGTLIEVGSGRRDPGSLTAVLAGGKRSRAGPTAPARGLCLVRVDY